MPRACQQWMFHCHATSLTSDNVWLTNSELGEAGVGISDGCIPCRCNLTDQFWTWWRWSWWFWWLRPVCMQHDWPILNLVKIKLIFLMVVACVYAACWPVLNLVKIKLVVMMVVACVWLTNSKLGEDQVGISDGSVLCRCSMIDQF